MNDNEHLEEHLTAGIDTGASAVKVAIMKSRAGDDGEILAEGFERIRRRDVRDVVRTTLDAALAAAGVQQDDLCYITSTGDGDPVPFRTGHFYSMTCHARGAVFLDPEAVAAIDMGAFHARAIRLDKRGKVLGHRMTSQCASGSGQFLENIARYLGVPMEDVGKLSVQAKNPEKCSGVCAVLAETDVINMVSRGISTSDILKGIHLSIAGRLVRLVRAISKEGAVMATGGLANDVGLLAAMREIAQKDEVRGHAPLDLRMNKRSALAGAIGGALVGAYRYNQLAEIGRLPASA